MVQVRARVFISCGQSRDTDEIDIAHRISERLTELGFDPYVAVAEQTLRGLKENIFGQLRGSEYFVFVDFKRETLDQTEIHRGSLFSHQELAIASYLEMDVIAFQEKGVKRDDGVIRFLQANAIEFIDKNLLPNVVADIVQQRGWKPDWKNALIVEKPPAVSDAPQIFPDRTQINTRFFHINVRNLHREKLAINCYVYLEKAIRRPNTTIPLRTIEFKWAGTLLPAIGIAPGTARAFDAFFIHHNHPTQLLFNALTDSGEYYPQIPPGIGEYEFSYVVMAENFAPARGTFTLDLRAALKDTTFA